MGTHQDTNKKNCENDGKYTCMFNGKGFGHSRVSYPDGWELGSDNIMCFRKC